MTRTCIAIALRWGGSESWKGEDGWQGRPRVTALSLSYTGGLHVTICGLLCLCSVPPFAFPCVTALMVSGCIHILEERAISASPANPVLTNFQHKCAQERKIKLRVQSVLTCRKQRLFTELLYLPPSELLSYHWKVTKATKSSHLYSRSDLVPYVAVAPNLFHYGPPKHFQIKSNLCVNDVKCVYLTHFKVDLGHIIIQTFHPLLVVYLTFFLCLAASFFICVVSL